MLGRTVRNIKMLSSRLPYMSIDYKTDCAFFASAANPAPDVSTTLEGTLGIGAVKVAAVLLAVGIVRRLRSR